MIHFMRQLLKKILRSYEGMHAIEWFVYCSFVSFPQVEGISLLEPSIDRDTPKKVLIFSSIPRFQEMKKKKSEYGLFCLSFSP